LTALDAVRRRRSRPKVTQDAPSDEQLLPLVAAAAGAADHAALRPWRLVALRGEARERLGEAFVAASGLQLEDAQKLAAKPLRAPLLLAVVVRHQPSFKVADWEQDAAASGVAHYLSLLLDEAGWGVMWRTGGHTRSEPVRRVHELADNEELLGWLYVGGVVDGEGGPTAKSPVDAREFLSTL
jgi:nitroreductase